jgi:hypothetical protein
LFFSLYVPVVVIVVVLFVDTSRYVTSRHVFPFDCLRLPNDSHPNLHLHNTSVLTSVELASFVVFGSAPSGIQVFCDVTRCRSVTGLLHASAALSETPLRLDGRITETLTVLYCVLLVPPLVTRI